MCCCKAHLHGRWGVVALVKMAKEQKINIPFSTYENFFEHLSTDCKKEVTTYLDWTCIPNKESCFIYGSCDLFKEYELVVKILKTTSLRSDIVKPADQNDGDYDNGELNLSDFLVSGTVCAVAADDSSSDTVWFIKITGNKIANEEVKDDYNHVIVAGNFYIEGNYLERQYETNKGHYFNVTKKKSVYFFQESVVYPFVLFQEKGGKLFVTNDTIVDIIYYVENNGLSSI